jgi:small-conductance mechanosensitive channel
VLIRIWAYTYLSRLFSPAVIEKIISTGFGFILTILIIYTVRRLIDTLKIDNARRRQYRQWSVYVFVFLYILILIRIWAYTNLFRFTDNPIVSKLITSGIVLGMVYLALFFVRRYINSLKVEIGKRHQYRKRASYVAALIYILILIPIWAGSTQQWATVLSVMGAGIALALHEVLLNMAGWVYIVVRRPYKEGDRIELGSIRGDVIDIQLFQTTLLEIGNWVDGDQSTGRVVHLPHGQIFRNPLYNYTKGFEFIWNETSIIITFESHWERAGDILMKCGEEESHEIQESVQKKIDKMSHEYLIYYKKFTPIVYTKIEESGVKLTLRYLTEAKKRRTGLDTINRKIISAINAAPDIDFAYPTYRIYKRGEEKKS